MRYRSHQRDPDRILMRLLTDTSLLACSRSTAYDLGIPEDSLRPRFESSAPVSRS